MSASYVVRYGSMRQVGEFSVKGNLSYPRNCEVVVRSERGVEAGRILGSVSDRTRDFLRAEKVAGHILRELSEADRRSIDELRDSERQEFDGCCEMIGERELQMQLVDVEHILGGERLVFYYLAEKRVDFRELVKDLAKRFQTRIEMRQIGVRDEARLLADYGDCGRPVCCASHLASTPPISMKMAKLQKATLDPTKISGRCGRLKCCLRYEYDTYQEIRRELPRVDSLVVTRNGQGKVIRQEVLARKLLVRYEDHRVTLIDEADVLTVVNASRLPVES